MADKKIKDGILITPTPDTLLPASDGTGRPVVVSVGGIQSTIPTATPDQKGTIKVGSDFDISDDGTLSLYSPMKINSFTGGSDAEIGSTVASVSLKWTLNKTPELLTIDGTQQDTALRSLTVAGPFTATKSFTLLARDARGAVAQTTTALTFKHRKYYGTSSKSTLTNADILALANKPFATSRATSVSTYDCTGGRYPYICFPKSWGTPSFIVGGLPNSDFSIEEVSLTNASGATTAYYVCRTNGIQTGKLQIEVK